MTTDLFLITYPKDYEWLPFLFRSIDRYLTGFRKVVLVLEQSDDAPSRLPSYVEVKRCRDYRGSPVKGYHGQCIEKLALHEHTDADRILHIDSDCVFTAPIDLQTFEYPLICSPWNKVGDAICWFGPTRKVLGFNPPFETMRRYPFIYPLDFHREVYDFIGGRDRLLSLLTGGMQSLSEFNILGNYAIVKTPERFTICRSDVDKLPPLYVRQFWSHDTISKPEVKAELERMGLA